jgi:hypothetical protein
MSEAVVIPLWGKIVMISLAKKVNLLYFIRAEENDLCIITQSNQPRLNTRLIG